MAHTTLEISFHPETLRLCAYLAFYVMVAVSLAVTTTTVKVDLQSSALMRTFGYNNVCVFWDYSPAREIAALVFPVTEYLFQAYVLTAWIRAYQSYAEAEVSLRYLRAVNVISPITMTLLAWVRIIFVIDGEQNLLGHTLGFTALQIALLLVAYLNYFYNEEVDLLPFQGTLGKLGARLLSLAYLVSFTFITYMKMLIVFSIFAGTPVVDTTTPSGAAGAQFVDIAWMFLGAILPAVTAWQQRWKTRGIRIASSSPHIGADSKRAEVAPLSVPA
ncbi:hypothetical protein T492DRAFT_981117 [Pavlovales sp. CCMP2436]|nr:hypothetical protein T492DRAFT_981117 [Pavlovales sp. CCMP2436]